MKNWLWSMLVAPLLLSPYVNGAYLESDGYPEPARQTPDKVLPPPARSGPEAAVTRLARQVRVGSPWHYRGLTIFPLSLDSPPSRPDILTLDEAVARDWLVLQEKADAQVSEIRVRNASSRRVFLMSGEILAGGRQNRLVQDDVLLPPNSDFIAVRVYCGEHDRWQPVTDRFRSPETLAAPSLRKGAAAGASQDAIWREIDEQRAKMGVESPTRSYQQIYDEPSVQRELDDCFARFREVPSARTVGAVAMFGNRVVAADIFSDPALFSRLWRKLVRAYAVEYAPFKGDDEFRAPEGDARDFIDKILSARFNEQYTPGSGALVVIAGSVSGKALVWDDEAVHVALFPRDYAPQPVSPPPPHPVPVPMPRPMWR